MLHYHYAISTTDSRTVLDGLSFGRQHAFVPLAGAVDRIGDRLCARAFYTLDTGGTSEANPACVFAELAQLV